MVLEKGSQSILGIRRSLKGSEARAKAPQETEKARDRVEVVIPVPSPYVFTEVYSLAHASPSASHWPLLPPPPSPLSFFPPASLSPAAVPNPAIVPNPAAVRRSSRPRRPVLPPTPSTSTPSASAGIKIVDLALRATKRVHGVDNIVCSLVIEIKAIFHNPIDPEHPPLPPRSVTISPGMRRKTCKGVGQAFAYLIGAFLSRSERSFSSQTAVCRRSHVAGRRGQEC